MKKALTSGLVLLILGVVCGTILGVVNFFTSPIIEARLLAEKYAALEEFGIVVTDYTVTERASITTEIDKTIFLKQGANLKIAVYSVTTTGYSAGLNVLIAVDDTMKVIGYKFIANSETPGIGQTALEADGFHMIGAILPDTSLFDSYSGATMTSDGVLAAFTLVATQAAIDFGGGQ